MIVLTRDVLEVSKPLADVLPPLLHYSLDWGRLFLGQNQLEFPLRSFPLPAEALMGRL